MAMVSARVIVIVGGRGLVMLMLATSVASLDER